jgi:hypothetical protein
VAAATAQGASAMGALTQAAAAGGTPTKTEYDKTVVDAGTMRTLVNTLVTDMTNTRTTLEALRASLHNGGVIG